MLYYLLNGSVYTFIILILGYVIASVNGFLGFRFIVFGATGSHPVVQYLKYQAVYLPMLGLNLVFLPFMLSHTSLNAYVIQAMYGAFSVVFGYLGSKYFAFRRARPGNIQDRS